MIQTVKQENKAVNEKLIHTTYFNNETSRGFGRKANIMFADNPISDLPFGMYHVIFTINTLSKLPFIKIMASYFPEFHHYP